MNRSDSDHRFLPDHAEWEAPPEGAALIRRILQDDGHQAVFVGGCVRDALLGRPAADWDIGTSARPETSMRLFLHHGLHVIPTGLQHGTVTVLWDGAGYEVTVFREDGDYTDGRRPDTVAFTDSLERDLARRDFTMNAIAWDPDLGLIDPFNGRADIAAGLIRTVGDPDRRFSEDALRMMRAIRFAGRLGFAIDPGTLAAIRVHAAELVRVSAERVSSELVQTAASPHPEALRLFHDTGLLPHFLPELEACYSLATRGGQTIGEHCVQVAIHSPPSMVSRIAGLLHDIARKPDPGPGPDDHAERSAALADTVLRRLRFSIRDRERIVWLIAQHDRTVPATLPQVRRLLGDAGEDRWEDWKALVAADILANRPADMQDRLDSLDRMADRIRAVIDAGDPVSIRRLAVDGGDAVRAGFRGKAVGLALERCLNQVMERPEDNTRPILLDLLAKHREDLRHD